MRLAFVNVAFLLHGIILHILIHTHRHDSHTDCKVVVAATAAFCRMLFASCSECRKSSPAKAAAAAAGENIKIKTDLLCIRRVYVCVCVQAAFLSTLN